MHIQNLISTPPVVCRYDDTLNTAAQLMWEHDCGAVPCVNGEGELVGMLTDRDICMAAYTQGRTLREIPVELAMTLDPVSCSMDTSLEAIESMMRDSKIRRVPIVDTSNRPVGILSINDIARHAAASRGNGLNRQLTQTLAAISSPPPPPPAE